MQEGCDDELDACAILLCEVITVEDRLGTTFIGLDAILHEACCADGHRTGWSAARVRPPPLPRRQGDEDLPGAAGLRLADPVTRWKVRFAALVQARLAAARQVAAAFRALGGAGVHALWWHLGCPRGNAGHRSRIPIRAEIARGPVHGGK